MTKESNEIQLANPEFLAPQTEIPHQDGDSQQRRMLLQRTTTYEEHYEGPLPHPDILRRYDEIVPGASREILDAFKEQSEHRRTLEKTVILGDSNRAYLGIACGLIISLGLIYLCYTLAISGHAVYATILGMFDVAAIVSVFVYGTNSRNKERSDINQEE